jgi:hypothetical protein
MARLLRRAGIRHIRGFFLNSSHFDWTSNELRYGNKVAILCNPPGRGLGPRPTTATGDPPGATWFPAYALDLAINANAQLGPGSPSQPY